MDSPDPVTLVCIGPVPNIAEALRREPGIVQNARFAGMHGSIAWHARTNLCLSMEPGPIPEYNVMRCLHEARAVLQAPWKSTTITPLDTCARVVLDGDRYARLRSSNDPLVRAVMENYDIWSPQNADSNPEVHSSVLFDTVAIHLAYTTRYLTMKRMRICVDDEGFTRKDPAGTPMNVAIAWEDLPGYLDELTARLLGE